jgi:hypothetical protein
MENIKTNTRTSSCKWILTIVSLIVFHATSIAETVVDTPEEIDSGANPFDAPVAPIDGYIWILMAIGIGFALYNYKVKQNKI